MDVEVIVKKWGTYSKGDTIKGMPDSTAKACIKAGVIEELGKPKKTKSKE